MSRVILHIDMDSFFASVEQLDHPEYEGKPVIVGADPKGGKGRGVVSAASYEARKYGIHSAMPISRAYRLCPQGIFLPVRMDRYQEVSRKIMAILRDYSPVIEQISIDEAFLDITGSLRLFGSSEDIGRAIKERIKKEIGLTASVGIAPNKFIAKIASDLEKPDGFVVVKEGEQRDFLKDLPISKLWGVGEKTESILKEMGITTIGDLANYPQDKLIRRFGRVGITFWQLANGIDNRPVAPESPAKSVSQERTFQQDTDNLDLLRRTLFRLTEDLGRILRKGGLKGRTITLKIRLEDFSTFTRSKTLSDFTNSVDLIRRIAWDMLSKFDRQGKKVRLLGIGISQLNTMGGEQLGLFESPEEKIPQILDSVQDKFGEGTIRRAILSVPRKFFKNLSLDLRSRGRKNRKPILTLKKPRIEKGKKSRFPV